MKSKLTDEALTKWAAEKYLPKDTVLFLPGYSVGEIQSGKDYGKFFNPISNLNHLVMVVESEWFPRNIDIQISRNWFDLIIDFSKIGNGGPLKDLGRKLLEVLWEMEEGK